MTEIVIIADDLTGANATGVLFSEQGYQTGTFLDLDTYTSGQYDKFDVISISTDSRGIEESEAYSKVAEVVTSFQDKEVKLFSKRIDSTLRGNVGSEIDAVLDRLDDEFMAIVVPAFPSSERINVGSYLLVNSIPLQKTGVADDPKTPVLTSYVPSIIKAQSKYSVGSIPLDKVLGGVEEVKKSIIKEKEKGNQIIVFDAIEEEDINIIAKGVKATGFSVVAVDPGPFTLALGNQMLDKKEEFTKKVLVTVGSVTDITRKQIINLEENYSSYLVLADSKALLSEKRRSQEIKRVSNEIIENMAEYEVIGVISSKNKEDVLDLKKVSKSMNISEEEIAIKISTGFAAITSQVLKERSSVIDGLFVSGGDITVAVSQSVGAVGMNIKKEILPLAVYGKIIGGEINNLPIVTKGGLIGDFSAITTCINYLFNNIN